MTLLHYKSSRWIHIILRHQYSTTLHTHQKHIYPDFQSIDAKWRNTWSFPPPAPSSPKFYVLAMFPYPSGNLHMGHCRVYTISDTISRYRRMKGYHVLHPMGFDSFGLPAENAAIERNLDPMKWTEVNMDGMGIQMDSMNTYFDGFSSSRSRGTKSKSKSRSESRGTKSKSTKSSTIYTSSPEYYRFTQSLFLKLYAHDYCYRKSATVNWDPVEQTVLANEQVDDQGRSWRSGAIVEKREMKQWFLRITKMADDLFKDLDLLDWPQKVKTMQRNWIGHDLDSLHIHDWLISRQRYWGTPIPIVHCHGSCGVQPLHEQDLPVLLPQNVTFTNHGGSPLLSNKEWLNTTCPKCNGPATREAETMDTFVDSSWYFLRYTDPENTTEAFDAKKASEWMPVDLYIGGIEHAILHLLYARFIAKFYAEIGDWKSDLNGEPFKFLLSQGMVHAKTFTDPKTERFLRPEEVDTSDPAHPKMIVDGQTPRISFEKMSKSKYNGVDPTECFKKWGVDCTRAYTLFSAPVSDILEWDEAPIVGVQRWLTTIYRSIHDLDTEEKTTMQIYNALHKTIKEADRAYAETYALNTLISNLMTLTNTLTRNKCKSHDAWTALLRLLAPVCPAFAEECWSIIHGEGCQSIFWESFPSADHLTATSFTCVVQVNGKKYGSYELSSEMLNNKEKLLSSLGDEEGLNELLQRQKKLIIAREGRLINIVV